MGRFLAGVLAGLVIWLPWQSFEVSSPEHSGETPPFTNDFLDRVEAVLVLQDQKIKGCRRKLDAVVEAYWMQNGDLPDNFERPPVEVQQPRQYKHPVWGRSARALPTDDAGGDQDDVSLSTGMGGE